MRKREVCDGVQAVRVHAGERVSVLLISAHTCVQNQKSQEHKSNILRYEFWGRTSVRMICVFKV